MAFVKHQGIDPRIDYWEDSERNVLTIVADSSQEVVRVLFFSEPDALTKEELLKEAQGLYPDRSVVLSEEFDKNQTIVAEMTDRSELSKRPLPEENKRYSQRDVIIVGGAGYYSYRPNGYLCDPTPTLRSLEPRKPPPPTSPTGINRKGKPAKHWQR